MTDWQAIKEQYEQGISQRSLALKHGISQAAISKKAAKEKWVITPVIIPSAQVISNNQELESNIPALLEAALRGLAQLNPLTFTLIEQKLFADALNQYNKIKLTLPQDDQDYAAYDLRKIMQYCTSEQLAIIKPILVEAEAKRADAEQDDKIRPLKKFG